MPAASAVRRSPRLLSSANRSRKCSEPACRQWTSSSFQAGRSVSGSLVSGSVSVGIFESFFFLAGIPKPEASAKSVGVVTGAALRRQLVNVLYIAAAEDRVFRLQGGDEVGHDIRDLLPPLVLAQTVETPLADVVFKRSFLIRHVPEFHRLDHAIHDHRGAEAGAESQEQHL